MLRPPDSGSSVLRRVGVAPSLEPYQARFATPFAVLGIRVSGNWLTDIHYLPPGAATLDPRNAIADAVCRQIERYLDDPEFRFDIPFQSRGTPFQAAVWREIGRIASGRTRTYGEIARRLESGPRAVGGACGANRVPLVIPCHRVVGATGLGGFMNSRGGLPLAIKQWLLVHEGVLQPAA